MITSILGWRGRVLLVLSINYCAVAGIGAPFGLTWGTPQTAIKGLQNCRELKKSFTICKINPATPLFKTPGDHWVMFSRKHGLIKTRFRGQSVKDDRYGIVGKEQFNQLKAGLRRRHPGYPQKELIAMHREVYRRPAQFYECLKLRGCGYYYFLLGQRHEGQGRIVLKLNGQAPGRGYLSVVHESPVFVTARHEG